MKKVLLFFAVTVISLASFAQHQCNVHYTFQNPPSTLQTWFVGYAWNSDSSQINVTRWEWVFGDGTSATTQDPTHTYSSAGTYRVCVYISTSDGCTTYFCDSITIGQNTPTCHAMIAYNLGTNNDIYLNGSANNGNGGTLPVLSYYWNFGDGTGGHTQDPHHVYSHAGTYQVCLTIMTTDSCTSTICDNFTVGANTNNCMVNFSYQTNPGALAVYFEGNAWNTDSSQINVSSYTWSFGDGTTGTGITSGHVYPHAGIYRVCIVVHSSSGCVADFCDSVQVGQNTQPNCIPSFTYYRDSTNMNIYTYHFTGYSGNNNYNTTRWEWGFGDGTGAITRDPYHTFAHAGWYQICVYIIDSIHQCYGHYCDSIHIGGTQTNPCQAAFSFGYYPQRNVYGFYGYDINNPNYPQNITSFYWDFGDGSSANTQEPFHSYYHPGIYYVCLTITTNNNCTSTYCDSIEIHTATPTFARQTGRLIIIPM